ncbi:MAG: hypothetical protein FAZ92_02733 [Accumulibacter sp.]|nr:MAG: hypothetical protein FAZ92_02733 [Accumulibacter sp.]
MEDEIAQVISVSLVRCDGQVEALARQHPWVEIDRDLGDDPIAEVDPVTIKPAEGAGQAARAVALGENRIGGAVESRNAVGAGGNLGNGA